ncbi:MAG: iron ABC transporter substrate-binding protein [Lentisphaeraceae bacterium]|nr:iron ABC transporter substrate-binding protein [Lentisphaeraceae bacterium]
MKYFLLAITLFLLGACDSKKGNEAATPATDGAASTEAEVKELLVYSGRKEVYAKPLFELFEKKTGIKIVVKPGKTTALANTLITEKENSPADIFFAQDSSNLGALSAAGVIAELPEAITNKVDSRFRSPKNEWVGTSGRARVLVYNKDMVKAEDLPKTMQDLTDPKWKGKLGWAPKNGSFQSHLTAMIQVDGAEKTTAWLKAMKANGIADYPKNSPIVKAVAEGKIAAGLVNHYYLYKIRKDMKEAEKAENHFFADGDVGMFVNISGVAVVKASKKQAAAQKFVDFLLSKEAQEIFKEENFEYPLAASVEAYKDLKPLKEINPVKCDLGDLDKIENTQKVLEAAGCL